jgi:AcrR family transcriptional regulator
MNATRTQAQRSGQTRAALIAAARRLFAERGYAEVGTEEIVREAGVTRGALYHHFDGKRELMRAVYEQLEEELSRQFAESVTPGAEPLQVLREGAETFLDQCLEREVQQIALLDAPAVLGWEEWREINARYALGLIEGVLRHGMEIGSIREQPARPLAHALIGALDEVAMLVARSDDPEATRAEVGATLTGMLEGLRGGVREDEAETGRR